MKEVHESKLPLVPDISWELRAVRWLLARRYHQANEKYQYAKMLLLEMVSRVKTL